MTRVVWDKIGERTFDTGLDRGVLYLNDTGYVWNGLMSIDRRASGEQTVPVYIDGYKVRDIPSVGPFEATLKAFTYPDEFLVCEGVKLIDGVFVDGQIPQTFGLSFRTLIGNDVEGVDHGYRIHILYNLTAVPDAQVYQTLSLSDEPSEFAWDIAGVPQNAPNFRPTSYIYFDTRFLEESWISDVEGLLYGDEDSSPTLPTIEEFFDLFRTWGVA